LGEQSKKNEWRGKVREKERKKKKKERREKNRIKKHKIINTSFYSNFYFYKLL
jgi:hypothetical protein